MEYREYRELRKGLYRSIAALKANLTKTDYQAIKFFEGHLTAEEYEPIKAQRQAWRDEINELEARLKKLVGEAEPSATVEKIGGLKNDI